MDYEKMLDRLYMTVQSKTTHRDERLEIPRPDFFIQGRRTFVRNFGAIAKAMRREERTLAKFLTRELAAQANVEEGRLILNTKLMRMQIERAFDHFLRAYVTCPVCQKYDTHFEDRKGVRELVCEACGARNPVKKV